MTDSKKPDCWDGVFLWNSDPEAWGKLLKALPEEERRKLMGRLPYDPDAPATPATGHEKLRLVVDNTRKNE